MKQLPRRESMQYYIGICFLLLLSSQEVISVNERIEHGVKGQMSMNLMGKAKQMLRQMEVAGNSMGADAELSVNVPEHIDVQAVHDAMRESFSFKNSPMLGDLEKLTPPVKGNEKPSNLHKNEIMAFIQKAGRLMFDKLSNEHGTPHDIINFIESGRLGKALSDRKETTEEEKKEIKKDMNEIMKDTDRVEDAMEDTELSTSAVVLAALFGLFDGIFSGFLRDFRDGIKEKKCQDGMGEVKEEFENVARKTGELFRSMKKLFDSEEHSWYRVDKWGILSESKRKEAATAFTSLLTNLIVLMKAAIVFLGTCPATLPLLMICGVIGVALVVNKLIIFSAMTILPLIVKVVGMLMEVIFGIPYAIDIVKKCYKAIKNIIKGQCEKKCKINLIESFFQIAGFVFNIIVMSGLTKIVKIKGLGAVIKGKPGGLKNLKLVWHHDMAADLAKLNKKLANTKAGKAVKKITPKDFGGKAASTIDDTMKGSSKMPINADDSLDLVKKGEYKQNMFNTNLDDTGKGLKNADALDSFHQGKHNVVTLEEDLVLYRAGNSERSLGQYFTRAPPKDVTEVRKTLAVRKHWKAKDGIFCKKCRGAVQGTSELDTVYKVTIPKGTTIYEGPVASMGAGHRGGGVQIFVDQPWKIDGVADSAKKIGPLKGGKIDLIKEGFAKYFNSLTDMIGM